MESGLTPREIQERIRAGQSLDEVTEVAGMPRDRVERFALAVFDERRHMADQARVHSVRRTGESGSHRLLGEVVDAWFTQHEVDPDSVSWDATRDEDRHRWTVLVRWATADEPARFTYDVRGMFSTAQDESALELIGDDGTGESFGGDETGESDDEPTINYADQFAIVNVLQDDEASLDPAPDTEPAAESEPADEVGQTVSGPFDLHDIVPTPESELDALYAMLRGHQEDSVNIYAGLSEAEQPPASTTSRRRRRGRNREADDRAPEPAREQAEPQPPVQVSESAPHPDQPSLIEDEPPAPPPTKRRPRKRAAVPSWDEIMFGGPDKD